MFSQIKLTWPSKKDCMRLNKIIFETDINPFGLAAYNPNEPVTDFVGRREELGRFRDKIRLVFKHKISRAVRLEGPGGVGKSTLFNYLKESIEAERSIEKPKTDYILKNFDIFSTYFQIPDKISDFSDIWKPMLEGLKAGFELETGYDISLPEYIAFKIIFRMFLNDRNKLSEIIWLKDLPPKNILTVELKDIIDPLFNVSTD